MNAASLIPPLSALGVYPPGGGGGGLTVTNVPEISMASGEAETLVLNNSTLDGTEKKIVILFSGLSRNDFPDPQASCNLSFFGSGSMGADLRGSLQYVYWDSVNSVWVPEVSISSGWILLPAFFNDPFDAVLEVDYMGFDGLYHYWKWSMDLFISDNTQTQFWASGTGTFKSFSVLTYIGLNLTGGVGPEIWQGGIARAALWR